MEIDYLTNAVALVFLQCFDTVDWTKGKTSSLYISKIHLRENWPNIE